MGISSIQHNMLMVNADRRMRENAKVKAKSAEKLSSGYRINRAADDAAGLSMSEKMRFMIRGLEQGTENVMDGISWVQIGDGSLEEAHGMLHRMTELAIKASNGTCTDDDRMMMQAEFAHLQKEIDRLTDNTTFNEQHIFQEHEWPYHEIEGSTYWSPTQYHTVREGDNDLVITYAVNENDPLETATITVDPGKYTTRELVDEIDTALEKAGLLDKGVRFTYTDRGFCNLDLEGGRIIDGVTGGLSYLLYDNFGGGSLGALIGTTRYTDDTTPRFYILAGKNNEMTFQVISPERKDDGSLEKTPVTVKLLTGTYSKNGLIQEIKDQIDAQAPGKNIIVEPQPNGNSIRVSSPDYIISEFKGNMFTIDGGLYTSVFYDNIKYSDDVKRYPAQLQGGFVVRDQNYLSGYDNEGSVFHFQKGVNDTLVLNPNGRGELVIDMLPMDGRNIDAVVNYLQDQLKAFTWKDEDGTTKQGAALNVSKVVSNSSRAFYANGAYAGMTRYAGINILSTQMGPDSTVGIDRMKSTAFDTLFTAQRVNNYATDATFGGNDSTPDANDYYVGLRNLSGGVKTEAGKSDAFEIQIDGGNWETVTLSAGNYSVDTLVPEIQGKLDAIYGANKLIVAKESNGIKIVAADSDIKGIKLRAHTETDGTKNIAYQEIFQSVTYKPDYERDGYSGTKQKAEILLPEVKELNNGKITIDAAHGNLIVRVDEYMAGAHDHSVNLTGSWTLAELKQKIEDAMPTKEVPITFNPLNDHGYTTTTTAAASVDRVGETRSDASRYSNYRQQTGYTPPGEGGDMAMEGNKPAVMTFAAALDSTVEITSANKDFNFTLNGTYHTIDLTTLGGSGTYSRDDFVNKLQAAVTAELGGKAPDAHGGMEVKLNSSNRLELTAGLKIDGGGVWPGGATDITMEVSQKGGFIYNLHDTSTSAKASLGATSKSDQPGSYTTYRTINNGFTGSGTLDLKLEKPGGVVQNISVTINGATSREDLRSQLNNYFRDNGLNLTASIDSYDLAIETTGSWKGDGYKLSIETGAGKSSIQEKMFGDASDSYKMEKKTGIKVTTNQAMQKAPIVFQSAQSFQISVDGSDITATINAGTYNDWDAMVTEIQRAVGGSVTVTRTNSGQLSFETVSKNGKESKISLSYQNNSALSTIFGAQKIAGVTADFDVIETDASGNPKKVQLRLKRKPSDETDANDKGKIYVESNVSNSTYHKAGSFIMPIPEYSDPTPKPGHHSNLHSFMQGRALKPVNGEIEINQYNKKLSFYFSENYENTGNTPKLISFDMDEGKYDSETLKKKLQDKLDQATGGDHKLNVVLQNGGLRIEAVKAGSKYRIHTDSETTSLRPSGGFYDNILCGNELSNQKVNLVTDEEGKQDGGHVYAMGRQDVKNKVTKIQRDGNDELSLEFTTPTGMHKLEMILDPGYYNSDDLVKQIQMKLDEALEKKGLPKGLVEAVVGYQEPGTQPIIGSLDDRALAFKLSDKVAAPQNGTYKIEAIGGTAAFSVFYQTEGDIARAYVMGGQDITNGVTIKEGQNTLSVDVDGDSYEIELTPGYYAKADDLIKNVNDKLKEAGAPLKAYEDGGRLKLMHSKYGKHTINHLSGSVKNQLFFTETGEWAGDQPMRLRASGASGDWIDVDKPWMDTSSLGINTLTIEKIKNAQKAITRVKQAVTKVSEVRSYFGALQNRLESTVRNNQNKVENTTAAESHIRDADISKEAVENSIHNILEQSGVSVMAQIMQNSKMAIQLLQ